MRKLGETELMRSLSLSHAVSEAELCLGDHVYCWREGYTYAHHGVVVRAAPSDADRRHDDRGCAVVHFAMGSFLAQLDAFRLEDLPTAPDQARLPEPLPAWLGRRAVEAVLDLGESEHEVPRRQCTECMRGRP